MLIILSQLIIIVIIILMIHRHYCEISKNARNQKNSFQRDTRAQSYQLFNFAPQMIVKESSIHRDNFITGSVNHR